jgi:membrane associated rhomboid family serine protease
MFICPNCSQKLRRVQNQTGIFWLCDGCGGRAISFNLIRKRAGAAFTAHLWSQTQSAPPIRGKACPMCDKKMAQVSTRGMTLDLCLRCQFLWFDPAEFEVVPVLPPPPQPAPLPQEAKEILARYKVQQMAEELNERQAQPDIPPDEYWKIVPAVFGYPVEENEPGLRHLPLLSWSLAGLCVLATLLSIGDLHQIVQRFGFISAQPFRYGGLTVISSLLLHAGWMHLIGNMYFLMVFGDNVEDYLGKKRFLLLVVVAALSGDFLHWLLEPSSNLPSVGASGMISGVLAFYALQLPHDRLAMLWYYRWVRFPAWSAFVLWGLLQIVGVLQQLSGFSHVSALAHIGGALSGIVLWLWWRKGTTENLAPKTERFPAATVTESLKQ